MRAAPRSILRGSSFLLAALLLVGGYALIARLPARSDARGAERIVLIVVDTLRRDHLSSYGGVAPTPQIDALAAGGTVFENAVGSFHQTTMSMGALFTGRTPSIYSTGPEGVLPWNGWTWCGLARFTKSAVEPTCIPRSLPTLADVLRDAGYRTVGIVANPLLFRPAGFERGFDDWVELGDKVEWSIFASGELPPPEWRLQQGTRVNAAVRDWLAGRTTNHFFLYLHYMDVHDWALRQIPYDDGVVAVDALIGEVVQMLREAELLEHTTIVLTSDHGEALGEVHPIQAGPYHFGNPSFEPVLRVPLVVWPAIAADTRALVRSGDVHRLLRRIAGVEEGSPTVVPPGEQLLSEMHYETYRRGAWKSVWPRDGGAPLLFDLEHDPGERTDVAAAHPKRLAAHRSRIEELRPRLATAPLRERDLSPDERGRLRALGYVE